MNQEELKNVPVLAARNVVLFPGTTMPLNVGRPKSVAAIEQAMRGDHHILIIAQKNDVGDGEVGEGDLYRVGTLSKIERVRGSAENGYQVLVRGVRRVHADVIIDDAPLLAANVTELDDAHDTDEKTELALATNIKSLAQDILRLVPAETRQVSELVAGIDDLAMLTNLCAEYIDGSLSEKQELLEMNSLKQRALRLLDFMQRYKEGLKLQAEIREKLSNKMGRQQREHILREQLKAIREELGDEDGSGKDDDYAAKIDLADMPADVKKIAMDEAKRLHNIGNTSPEAHVIRNYLDLLCAMPWNKSTVDAVDLDAARASLDADHYGLEKVKKRIIQHLAVRKLNPEGKGSILLLVGPPGVGKTSLGQSIAKALDRKFVRVSLGGVRDDAEIRGHRRTYIGAMPGRVVQGVKRAGVNNPVLMLDEIDKLGRGFGGDPASALLEVLDPEQNGTFTDHYLDVPFDLSKTFFIATANSLETIPGPLLDRMETIELSGYTTAEKLHIAKSHLIPKLLKQHGLTPQRLKFTDEVVMRTITHYTREAGVRELERRISECVRGMSERVLAAGDKTVTVVLDDLDELLGSERFVHEVAERMVPPGVVTGLAWTPQGGEILFIEASLMPGTGKLTLTGQLGEVMKESVQIAMSLARSHLPAFVPGFEFDKKDVHVHVPAGAIPKDGPSAGITMLTTLASLFTGRSVDPKVAMTGEITLRGAVMPVGGVKEKVIAAHRAGIERIILSRRNEKDLKDVPAEVKSELRFDFVDTAADVLKLTLGLEVQPFTAASQPGVLPPAPAL